MKALVLWVVVALLAAVGAMLMAPRVADAQVQQPTPPEVPEEGWRPQTEPIEHLPPGTTFYCGDPAGCVFASPQALRELLKRAGGTCGRIPPLPAPKKGTDT